MRSIPSVLFSAGIVLIVFSVLQAAPIIVSVPYRETLQFPMRINAIPAMVSLVTGSLVALLLKPHQMTVRLSMRIGGCVGSSARGLKVCRTAVLWSPFSQQFGTALAMPREIPPSRIGRQHPAPLEMDPIEGWPADPPMGQLGEWASSSAMISAWSNNGPRGLPTDESFALSPRRKGVYALSTMARQLETLSLIVLFSRKTWR